MGHCWEGNIWFFKKKKISDDATCIISRNVGGFCTGKGGLSKFVCIVVVEFGIFQYFLPFCRAAMIFLIEGTNASGWTTTFPSSPGWGTSEQSGIFLKKHNMCYSNGICTIEQYPIFFFSNLYWLLECLYSASLALPPLEYEYDTNTAKLNCGGGPQRRRGRTGIFHLPYIWPFFGTNFTQCLFYRFWDENKCGSLFNITSWDLVDCFFSLALFLEICPAKKICCNHVSGVLMLAFSSSQR